jgi:pantoate--beta-alanine ligase
MRVIRGVRQMQNVALSARRSGKTIGLVPTMGALHEGHLSLIRQARRDNDLVVVSIFVNPAQFGPGEDFKKYPRNLVKDAKLCRAEGADIIFYPDKKEVYPPGYRTYIEVEGLSDVLCGRSRPGHFKGVATIVAKFFNIVQPDTAYFGQKDAQQSVIIKRMAEDMNMPVKVMVMPTVREPGGLALSSRNTYLNSKQKRDAFILSRSLDFAGYLIRNGLRDTNRIIVAMKKLICKKRSISVDYISIVDYETLEPLKRIKGKCLIALAARVGKTRLIDNIVVKA